MNRDRRRANGLAWMAAVMGAAAIPLPAWSQTTAKAADRKTIRVVRTPDVAGADEVSWGVSPTYTAPTGKAMLRAVNAGRGIVIRRSPDNGRTWRDVEVIPAVEAIDSHRAWRRTLDLFYLDPDSGLLARFFSEWVMPTEAGKKLPPDRIGPTGRRTLRLTYQVSRDAGETWAPRQQIIERGPGCDAKHWARDVWFGKSTLDPTLAAIRKLSDGSILLPLYMRPTKEYKDKAFEQHGRPKELWGDAKWYFEGVCMIGQWRDDRGAFEWERGGPISLPDDYATAGTCGSDEPAIAVLDDGRLFAVVRTSSGHKETFRKRGIPVLPYCAVSSDGGRIWGDVRALTYSDGGVLYAPSAYSEFIRSSKTGKWYWICNMIDNPTYGECDPRHPLQIAELDTERLGIRRETVTIIEDKGPRDAELIRFSNFRVHEERETGDFILLMLTSYSELQKGQKTLPRPRYCYRISLPD